MILSWLLHCRAVFPVCITFGRSKPSGYKWLESGLTPVAELFETGCRGLETLDHLFKFYFLVADAPARSFVLQVESLNSVKHTSGFATKHVVVSVRHLITY